MIVIEMPYELLLDIEIVVLPTAGSGEAKAVVPHGRAIRSVELATYTVSPSTHEKVRFAPVLLAVDHEIARISLESNRIADAKRDVAIGFPGIGTGAIVALVESDRVAS